MWAATGDLQECMEVLLKKHHGGMLPVSRSWHQHAQLLLPCIVLLIIFNEVVASDINI